MEKARVKDAAENTIIARKDEGDVASVSHKIGRGRGLTLHTK